MQHHHRYKLEKYTGNKSRYHCPQCTKKEFTRYIDTATGKHIADEVGMCNRLTNCAYHLTPKQYFEQAGLKLEAWTPPPASRQQPPPPPASYTSPEVMKATLKSYEQNNFALFLASKFGKEIAERQISRYFIGTSKHWQGSTIFWQIDQAGRIRAGKIMLYNASTGKRIKQPYNHITWTHKAAKEPEYNLRQCFFGEHLLKAEPQKSVAIVESEKTAIIADLYLPQFVWLACGSLQNLSLERCNTLAGRQVVLFPDLKGLELWQAKARQHGFKVSDLLERKATADDRAAGYDLADYLLKFDLRDFNTPSKPEQQQTPEAVFKAKFAELVNLANGNAAAVRNLTNFFLLMPCIEDIFAGYEHADRNFKLIFDDLKKNLL